MRRPVSAFWRQGVQGPAPSAPGTVLPWYLSGLAITSADRSVILSKAPMQCTAEHGGTSSSVLGSCGSNCRQARRASRVNWDRCFGTGQQIPSGF